MLVNDTENHAHQGLATFLYKDKELTQLRFQFIQQTAPYLLHQHFITWGSAPVTFEPSVSADLNAKRAQAKAELADRMPTKPWSELVKSTPPGTLDGFGGPLDPKWMVVAALVRDGVLFYQNAPTPYGDYPYPLEMRFGVRSITKSVWNPLSLLRLAQTYGPWVLTLKVGDYVQGLVFTPIGIHHAPTVRTREPGDKDGYVWGNAGYYPTLDDLAKIAMLYRDLGAHNGQQLLNRQLTADLLSAKDAMRKKTDMSVDRSPPPDDKSTDEELYKMGFHFVPYIGSGSGKRFFLPELLGSGENQVILFPNGLISIRAAKAAELPKGTKENSGVGEMTAQAVDRLSPF